jgi:hypothetical protein
MTHPAKNWMRGEYTRMKNLGDTRDYLMEKLDRSLAIQEIDPTAFEHGPVKSFVVGNVWRPDEMKWVLIKGDGSRTEYPLLDIPEKLWGSFSREKGRNIAPNKWA